ncbi:hypothetical protein BH20VER3_BH20VER3_16150 [soil metagenome]
MGSNRDEARVEALRLLYEFKNCPQNEKNHWRLQLDSALDKLRSGTNISREEAVQFLNRKYYPEYRRRRKKSEGL